MVMEDIGIRILMVNLTVIAMGLLNLRVIITIVINLMIGSNTIHEKEYKYMIKIEMVIPPAIESLAYLISVFAMA